MAPMSIHQAIHGYRDGHRLLSSSTPLSAEASRTLLVLSDMSGPSTQPGFDQYLTAYPLTGTDLFVLAKTWYAPEMQRPGCVWTHSLLIPRAQVALLPPASLLAKLRRPQLEGVETAASTPVATDEVYSDVSKGDDFGDRGLAVALLGAVLGQPRPVIIVADTAAQFEAVFLRLWEELWPAERARFSFCTGALMPRSNAGVLLDLQAVPRAIPPSQFRKSASAALVLDPRALSKTEAWVDLVLDGAVRGDATFRTWLETAAGLDAGRASVQILGPIFGAWYSHGASARSALASVVSATGLDSGTLNRLIVMAFDRAHAEGGVVRQRELLQDLCEHRGDDLTPIGTILETQTRRLFEESRTEGVALVLSLLGSELTEDGERVLREAVSLLVPDDVKTFGETQAPFLSTIVGAKPLLAGSPVLWSLLGSQSAEVLSHLATMKLEEQERSAIVDAILTSGCDVAVELLVRFGGRSAIFRGLESIASGQIQFSWPWRSILSSQPNTVLEWLESLAAPSLSDLELGSFFLSPKATQARLTAVWRIGTSGPSLVAPRVAAFGLALAFWEGDVGSPLFAMCFQPTYDAAANSRLEYEAWDWLREQAPPVSWYREWDRCERLAAALARLLVRRDASLETVFAIVYSRHAIRKVVNFLYDDRKTRPYLKWLRKVAESSSGVGTSHQRDALFEGW